jgi:hypothetical protein
MTDAATSLSRSVCRARPGPAAQQVAGEHVGGQRQDQPEVPEPLGLPERHAEHPQLRVAVAEREAEQRELRRRAAVEATGHRRPGVDDVDADEDQSQRGDTEVDAAQPRRDRAEDEPGQPGEQDADDHADDRRQAQSLQCGRVPSPPDSPRCRCS